MCKVNNERKLRIELNIIINIRLSIINLQPKNFVTILKITFQTDQHLPFLARNLDPQPHTLISNIVVF